MGEYFEQVAHRSGDAKTAANWIMGEVFAALKATGQTIEHFTVRPADLAALLELVARRHREPQRGEAGLSRRW